MAVQKKTEGPEPSLKSTKQELLDAYNEMRQQLEEKDKTQLKPEQKVQEKKEAQVLAAVQATTADGVIQKINQLKQEMARTLSDLGDKLASEVEKYNQVQQAIDIKEKEVKEVFEIDRAAGTLAALIEAQHREQEQSEREMAEERERLSGEIESGGGSAIMLARFWQLVYTATQFPHAPQVRILVDGVAKSALGGEGVLIDRPASAAASAIVSSRDSIVSPW